MRWSNGRDAAIDVTVTSRLAATNVESAAAEAASSLDKAVKRKLRDTEEACRQGSRLLTLRRGNPGWSPRWYGDLSEANCGSTGKEQGIGRKRGHKPAVRQGVPYVDALQLDDVVRPPARQ